MYYSFKKYDLIDIVKSKTKNKMYDAILKSKNGDLKKVPLEIRDLKIIGI